MHFADLKIRPSNLNPRLHKVAGVTLTLTLSLLAIALSFIVHVSMPHDVYPYMSFYPSIFLSAWLCGQRAGIFNYVVGMLAGAYFFIEYLHIPSFLSVTYLVPTAVFSFTNITTIWLSQKYRLALEKQTVARAEIETALLARDEFLSMASHELKTPLTSIKMTVQLALKTTFMTKQTIPLTELTSIFNNCERQILRITALVNDLLDVSLLQSRRIRYTFADVNFSNVVTEVCEMYRDVAADSGSHIVAKIEPNLFARLDPYRFEQVIVNLLSNAIKYGSRKPIEVTVRKDDGKAVLEVRDHGIGIDKDKQARIFEQYERAVPEHNFNGLGLGLFIARSIVRSHNGAISFQSDLGKGSTFQVRLPLIAENHISEIKRAATLSGGAESHKLST